MKLRVADQLHLVGELGPLQVLQAGGRGRHGHELLLDGLAGLLAEVRLQQVAHVVDEGTDAEQDQVGDAEAHGPARVPARQGVDHQLGEQPGDGPEHAVHGGGHEQGGGLAPGRVEGQPEDHPVDPQGPAERLPGGPVGGRGGGGGGHSRVPVRR